MKQKQLIKALLVSLLTLRFTACNDNESSSTINSEKKVRLSKPEWEDRLTNYKDAGKWFQLADDDEIAAYNVGVIYSDKIKDYKKAIEWYLYSDSIKINIENLLNLANTYDEIKDYKNAIEYYKKTFSLGDPYASYNLALLFRKKIKDYNNAKIWYKKGIERVSPQ